jgi:hypothetical protein
MPVVIGSGSGKSGLAEFSVLSDKVRVHLDGKTYEIFSEDAPALPPNLKKGFVKMNAEGTVIWSVAPPPGTYFVQLVRFTAKKDMPPTAYMSPEKTFSKGSKTGVIPAQLMFTAQFDVMAGAYKGLTASMSLAYAFKPFDERSANPVAMIMGNGIKKLENFLALTGMDFMLDDIPWSDNVLPALEKMLVSRKKVASAEVGDKGWINELSAIPDGVKFE